MEDTLYFPVEGIKKTKKVELPIGEGKYGNAHLIEHNFINGDFVKYNFTEGNGNLYKEVWPINHKGEPQKDKKLLGGLKTNEENNPDLSLIKHLEN